MIQGRFGNTTGRPYVNGRLLLPRLRLSTNLSDTGADVSVLMPVDGIKMGIDYQALINPKVVGGVGGNASCFQESAVLAFDEPPGPHPAIPSVGRDRDSFGRAEADRGEGDVFPVLRYRAGGAKALGNRLHGGEIPA